jgi:Domain of unknown function (DU1801)
MLRPIDNYFLQQDEPIKSCLLFLRQHIIKQDDNISEAWKYGMPFYRYNGKMFCYLWVHKKHRQPYIGIVEGKRINLPGLIAEKRARMKILLIDPSLDLPLFQIDSLLKMMIQLYK